MQSKATTVAEYVASLPDDRRAAIEALRSVFRANLDPTFREIMQYGMIGYAVPHDVFPQGYHCDPKQPLPFAALASQKQHLSIYLMGLYLDPSLARWFASAWQATGRKLDMGKSCVRCRSLEGVAMDVLADALRRMPARWYMDRYLANMPSTTRTSARKSGAQPAAGAKRATTAKSKPAAGAATKSTGKPDHRPSKATTKKTAKKAGKEPARRTTKKAGSKPSRSAGAGARATRRR